MTPADLLRSLGLEAYLAAFEANGIEVAVLPTLTDADLRELGVVKLGDRKKILAAIARSPGTPRIQDGCQRLCTSLEMSLGFDSRPRSASPYVPCVIAPITLPSNCCRSRRGGSAPSATMWS